MNIEISCGRVECAPAYSSAEWQARYRAICSDRLSQVVQLKHDGTTTVLLAEFDAVPVVVKRYNTKNTWHWLRRGLRKSRAEICYQMAQRFSAAGIATPTPVAAIQAHKHGFKLRSWYLSHYLDGKTLASVAKAKSPPPEALVCAIGAFFSRMAAHRLSHGDMKASNLIWHQNSLSVIDLDAARHHRSPERHRRALQKDIQRLLENWPPETLIHQALARELCSLS